MAHNDDVQPALITRRAALGRGAAGLGAAASLSALLAACGSSSSASSSSAAGSSSASGSSSAAAAGGSMTGTLTLLTYPDWYGANEFADFSKLHPGLHVKTSASGLTGEAAQIAEIETNRGSFDLTLAGVPVSGQLELAGLLEPLDVAAVPNISLVAPQFRTGYRTNSGGYRGIPTDYGKTGFAYRSDLIPERPTSWHELFGPLAKKYSGKITMIKYDSDIQGTFLRYLGHSINTKVQSQLQAMQNAMLAFKPHLQAILETDYSKALIEGTALFAIDYDYDIAAAQQKNKHIVWVPPSEGMSAYLEGWVALKGSQHLKAVWDLMNFHLQPKNYASFIDAVGGAAYVEPAAVKYMQKWVQTNPAISYSAAGLKGVEFEQYLGPEQTAYRGKLWQQFLDA